MMKSRTAIGSVGQLHVVKKYPQSSIAQLGEQWQPDCFDSFSLSKIIKLVGRLAIITEDKLSELCEGGEPSSKAEKQIRVISHSDGFV